MDAERLPNAYLLVHPLHVCKRPRSGVIKTFRLAFDIQARPKESNLRFLCAISHGAFPISWTEHALAQRLHLENYEQPNGSTLISFQNSDWQSVFESQSQHQFALFGLPALFGHNRIAGGTTESPLGGQVQDGRSIQEVIADQYLKNQKMI
ncbi:hypothetical protein GJ496_000754 [Pomphorhynchus laevis]|nr:hypothetical protein GJ496_000754 [Pomphorhynchus laevis]